MASKMIQSPQIQSRNRPTTVVGHHSTNMKGSILTCCFLIVGALCLRIFVLPKRNSLATVASLRDAMTLSMNNNNKVVNSQRLYTLQNNNNIINNNNNNPHSIHLPMNPTGTMINDIVSLEHIPHESAIVVTLKNADNGGRCPNPYLVGRLSGPALVLLTWSTNTTSTNTKKVGRYQVPFAGTYFVEVIVVTCYDFSKDPTFDFQQTCLEDPHHHRLTRSNVKIDITTANNHHHYPDDHDETTQLSHMNGTLLTGFWS